MNKMIKILLSVMIVSFSVLIIPLQGQRDNFGTGSTAIQIAVKPTRANAENYLKEPPVSITHKTNNKIEKVNQETEEIESITDKKEWYITYKETIETNAGLSDKPETIYDCFTHKELELLFKVVEAEIGDEYSFGQKVNVASVIFNRLGHNRFPDTLEEILVAGQFASISDGRYQKVEVSEETILACEYAFSIEDTTGGCLFFDSNNKLKYKLVFSDGAHNFYKLWEE